MNYIQSLMNRAKIVVGSYEKLAIELNTSAGFLSEIRHLKKPAPPWMAARLAEIAGDEPKTAALTCLASQARNAEQAALWQRLGITSG